MSADVLRRAAALMRERAEAANECGMVTDCADPNHVWYRMDELRERFSDARRRDADATQIASWHPAVALAVADWLDATAVRCDLAKHRGNHSWRGSRQALTVARAYLGEAS